MAGGIRSKDVRTSWDDVTNDDKTKKYGTYDMALQPTKASLIPKREKIK